MSTIDNNLSVTGVVQASKAKIGTINTSWGTFAHESSLDGTNYAIAQDIRDTLINSSTQIKIRISNSDRMIIKGQNIGIGNTDPQHK